MLVRPIRSIVKKQRTLLHLDLHAHFWSDEGPLAFSLIGATPPWLVIGSNSGVLLGETPTVAHNVQYLVTIKASNMAGDVVENFLIKVTTETFMTSMTSAVLNLTRNKIKYGKLDHHMSAYEVLAYIFEYYRQSTYWAIFEGLIQAEVSKMNVEVFNKIQYKDFRRVILAKNPDIERHLRKKLGDDHVLLAAEFTNEAFHNVFRQAYLPTLVHPLIVWRYLGAPNLADWGNVKALLHDSSSAVVKQFALTQQQVIHQHQFHAPIPTLFPGDFFKKKE